MNALLAVASAVAVASTLAVILQRRAVHALLYLIVSFFALAVAMLALGAAFAAALEVIVYAGAILVLFVFVVMMLGSEDARPRGAGWIGPSLLALVLLGELLYAFLAEPGLLAPGAASLPAAVPPQTVEPKAVGIALFGEYAICGEIAAFLLLSGLVGAFHLGRRDSPARPEGGER